MHAIQIIIMRVCNIKIVAPVKIIHINLTPNMIIFLSGKKCTYYMPNNKNTS